MTRNIEVNRELGIDTRPSVPTGYGRKAKAEPDPVVKLPTKIEMWRTSDGRTHTNQGDANRAEIKLAFEKLVQPGSYSGRRYDQPIPLPNGILDRDQLLGWFEDHAHKLFPWLGVYVASIPERQRGVPVEVKGMTLDKIVSGLFMAAWLTGNGTAVFGLLAVLGLDGYTIGTRIMLVLVILFLCSVGNLLALHWLYDA